MKGSRKRPRLEKGQEVMDTDVKKEDEIKSDPKGINCDIHTNILSDKLTHQS